MKVSRKLTVAVAGIALTVIGSSQARPRQNSNAASAFDLGSISGNVYTNNSVGMTYEFPKGWFVDRAWIDAQNKPQDLGPRPADPQEAEKYD